MVFAWFCMVLRRLKPSELISTAVLKGSGLFPLANNLCLGHERLGLIVFHLKPMKDGEDSEKTDEKPSKNTHEI